MLFAVKERREGLTHNTGFWGEGGGAQGEGIGLFTVQKGTILKKCLNTFVPHCGLRRFQRLDAIQTVCFSLPRLRRRQKETLLAG